MRTTTKDTYPSPETVELAKALCTFTSQAEAVSFLRDLLTVAEIKEFANRWQMVKMLYEGHSYATIAAKLKTSTTTVTRVAHWLNNGMGGYKTIADRLFQKKSK